MGSADAPRALILTALRVEYEAVRTLLTDCREDRSPNGDVFECGAYQGETATWNVYIREIGMGNAAAAGASERAVAFVKPQVALFVGVAGGLKDVGLGDVVVGTKLYAYESGKDGGQFLPRPQVGTPTHRLLERARAEARTDAWMPAAVGDEPNPHPKVVLGAIAAGEKVLASLGSETITSLRTHYSDALAVEMEGFGFLEAMRANGDVAALVVRGISDVINRKAETDSLNWQAIAARRAAAFAYRVMSRLDALSLQASTELYFRRLISAAFILTGLYALEVGQVVPIHGISVSAGEVLASLAAIVGLLCFDASPAWGGGRRVRNLLVSVFALFALGDTGWAIFNFHWHASSETIWSIMFTRVPYNIAFVLCTVVLLAAVEDHARVFSLRTLGIAFVPVMIVASRFLVGRWFQCAPHRGALLATTQLIDIVALVVLGTVSIACLAEARDVKWSFYAAASLVLVFGDWSTQIADCLGTTAAYDNYEFFWASGVFALATASLSPGLLWSPLTVGGALNRNVRRQKLVPLAFGFATMLALCLSDFGTQIPVLRFVSVIAALAAFGSVFFAYHHGDSAV